MKATLLFLLGLISTEGFCQTDWLCTEEASQRKGSSIYSCGIGVGRTESIARTRAFDSAKEEFHKVCSASDDCINHRRSVEPARTQCEADAFGYVCHRLVIFTIEGLGSETGVSSGAKLRAGMTKQEVIGLFGLPKQTGHPIDGSLSFLYEGRMCQKDQCLVYFVGHEVTRYYNFNYRYTADLE